MKKRRGVGVNVERTASAANCAEVDEDATGEDGFNTDDSAAVAVGGDRMYSLDSSAAIETVPTPPLPPPHQFLKANSGSTSNTWRIWLA